MDVALNREENAVILSLKGRLDTVTSGNFEKELLNLVQAGETRLVLDFQELDYISSAGLRVLLKAAKELKGRNGRMAFCSVKDYIREIFELSGFVTFFSIHASREDSLKALS